MQVLVIGKAKTGTSVLSKTIQANLPNGTLIQEPKSIANIVDHKNYGSENCVTKIIYEHWKKNADNRRELLRNQSEVKFDKVVCIIRDPRDEFVSRLFYYAKPYFDRNGFDQNILDKWLKAIIKKEENPQTVTVIQLIHEMNSLFNINFFNNMKVLNTFFLFLKNNQKFVTTIRYEDFIDGKLEGLENALGFKLNQKVRDDEKVIKLTKRSAQYGNWRSFLTPTDVQLLKSKFKPNSFYKYDEWDLSPKEKLNPDHFSKYVAGICSPAASNKKSVVKSLTDRLTGNI